MIASGTTDDAGIREKLPAATLERLDRPNCWFLVVTEFRHGPPNRRRAIRANTASFL